MIKYDGSGNPVAEIDVILNEFGETVSEKVRPFTPEELRRMAYEREADTLRDRIVSYREEAEGWKRRKMEGKAAEAEAQADAALDEYLAKKEEIRARYPDLSAAEEE